MNTTKPTTAKDVVRVWHLVDVKGQTLGRVATSIAQKLIGKFKPYFARNMDCGDYVVVVNAKEIKITGNKQTDKMYYRHSGYPGGHRGDSFKEKMQTNPQQLIELAVKGMLPQNKLRATMLKRLKIFAGEEHTYTDKFKIRNPKSETGTKVQK